MKTLKKTQTLTCAHKKKRRAPGRWDPHGGGGGGNHGSIIPPAPCPQSDGRSRRLLEEIGPSRTSHRGVHSPNLLSLIKKKDTRERESEREGRERGAENHPEAGAGEARSSQRPTPFHFGRFGWRKLKKSRRSKTPLKSMFKLGVTTKSWTEERGGGCTHVSGRPAGLGAASRRRPSRTRAGGRTAGAAGSPPARRTGWRS